MTGTSRKVGGRQEAVLKQMKSLGIRQSRSHANFVEYSTSALTAGSDWEPEAHHDTSTFATTLQHDDFDASEALEQEAGLSRASSTGSDGSSSSLDQLLTSSSFQPPKGLAEEEFEYLQKHGLDNCTALKELGQGGYGAVDLVQVALPNGRTIVAARKVIHSPLYGISRYERELRGLMLCNECPYVVDLYAARCNEETSSYEFLLEYCPNGSLHDMLKAMEARRRGKEKLLMPKQRIQYYAACMLKGMEFVHSKGQAHRDIKPHNVLMAANGRPLLADTDAMESCEVTKRAGTAAYQAPELWRASLQGAGYTTKVADMYSFGVTLVEMAAHPSLSGGNAKLQSAKDDPAVSLPEYVPSDLRDLICGLLAPVGKRLTAEQAMQHAFFDGVDWESLLDGPLSFSVQLRA